MGAESAPLLPGHILESVRALFPHTQKGLIYFNHASTGPLSSRVVEATIRHLRERSEGSIDSYPDDLARITGCRENVRTLINAESADRIALSMNTSDALNIVARE